MPERPRHPLVLVVSASGAAGCHVRRALSELQVPELAAPPRDQLHALAVALGSSDPARADALRARAHVVLSRAAGTAAADRNRSPAAAWFMPVPGDGPLRWWELAESAGWDPVVVVAWQHPEVHLHTVERAGADAGGPAGYPAAAEAMAGWEDVHRRALTELVGLRCTVVPVGPHTAAHDDPGTVALLAEALGRPPRPPTPGAPPAADRGTGEPTGPVPSAGAEVILPVHRALADILDGLGGSHQALPVVDVPPPSGWAAALRRAGDELRRAREDTAAAWRQAAARGEDADTLFRALWQVGDELAESVTADLPGHAIPFYGGDATVDQHGYLRWIREREIPAGPPGSAETTDPRLAAGPLVSVVVPVYKPELPLLESAVGSVVRQTYGRWELCLCDDGSGDPAVTAALAAIAGRDARVKVTALAANGGISAATNGALAVATGEWVAFMDQDDELAPDALAAVVAAAADDPSVDLVYTDDDKIDREGRRFGPQFKPDWDPDLLLSMCYFSHLVAMRRSLVDDVGGLRSAFDGGQDWDLALRVSERARTVRHVPRVLYHWRAIPGSAALDSSYKPWAYEAARRAVADALVRRGEPGTVDHHPKYRGLYHVRRQRRGDPLVSVVVPFRDGAGMLQRCVDSLTADPGHDRMELVLVDNGSTEPEMLALLDRLSADDRVTVVDDPRPFNWAALNNNAIDRSRGDMVLTLNNDVTAASPGWLHEMVVHAERPDIGAVGARLLYPDGRVQHVGAVVGLGGIVAHPMRGLPGDHPGYMGFATVIRGWSAVTGACLLARRSVVDEVGGFDEQLAVAFNDVDFCLKVVERGYRIVTTPLAEMVHAESSTRGFTGYARDIVPFVTRWEHWLRGEDPLFSPNLSRFDARCVVRLPDEDAQWNRQLQTLGLS